MPCRRPPGRRLFPTVRFLAYDQSMAPPLFMYSAGAMTFCLPPAGWAAAHGERPCSREAPLHANHPSALFTACPRRWFAGRQSVGAGCARLPRCTVRASGAGQHRQPLSRWSWDFVPVARYGGRFHTLVELVPEPAQRDLLQQAVEVSIPPMLDACVAMPYAMFLRSLTGSACA